MLLIRDLIPQLDETLNSLNKKSGIKSHQVYVLYCVAHILRCGDGFLHLRDAGKAYPAKMLVRPAIESMIRLHAVNTKPYLLYRIALGEHIEDVKFARGLAKRLGREDELSIVSAQWDKVRESLLKELKPEEVNNTPLNIYEAAEEGNILPAYLSLYRLFCQYTHGALRAIGGGLDGLAGSDEYAIATSMTLALDAAAAMCDGTVPIADFVVRHAKLTVQWD